MTTKTFYYKKQIPGSGNYAGSIGDENYSIAINNAHKFSKFPKLGDKITVEEDGGYYAKMHGINRAWINDELVYQYSWEDQEKRQEILLANVIADYEKRTGLVHPNNKLKTN